jgi:hypothetical protein
MMKNKPKTTSFCQSSNRRLFERHECAMALLKNQIRPAARLIFPLILFFLSTAYGQEEILSINNSDAYAKKQRSAVEFSHELHMEEIDVGKINDCLDCHHDFNEDGENVLDEDLLEEGNEEIYCTSCHPTMKIDLKKAYHRQCMGCHRKLRKSGDDTGPELCGECHKKK